MSKPQTKIVNLEKQKIIKSLTGNKYNDPWSDTDPRQEKIFDHVLKLLDKGYVWRFDTSMSLGKLATNNAATEKIFAIVQSRNEKSGDQEGVTQYTHEFYILRRRLQRTIVMGEIQSSLYTLAGAKRAAAHSEGMKQGHQSRCSAIVLTPPSDISLNETLRDFKYISDVSNADSDDKTRPMDMASYANSLRGEWQLCCSNSAHWAKENVQNISDTKLKLWAKSFLKQTYSYEPVESTFTNIFNQVFSQSRGQVWDVAKEEIKSLWSDTFTNQEWVEEPTNGQYCKEVAYTGLKREAFVPLNNKWFKRPSFTTQRDEIGIVVNLEPTTDSISTVSDQKDKALKLVAEYNKNLNFAECGSSVVTRILMPSHINHPDDKLRAFEWIKTKAEFYPVKV